MASKILQGGGPHNVERVAWRRVQAGSNPSRGSDAPHESCIDIPRLEQAWQARVQEAHAAGLREGEAAGRNRASAELQPLLEKLAHTIDDLAQMRTRLRRQAESDLIQLALAIARRVLRRELVVDPEALHGLVLSALEKLQGQEVSHVRVHPSHAAAIAGYLSDQSTGSPVEVIADGSREPGTVIFETARGNLDASIDSQLLEIERGLTDRLRRQS